MQQALEFPAQPSARIGCCAPATTFIITRSPSRSNGWDGLRFFLGTRSGRLVERAGADHRACSALLTCSATAARSTPTLIDYESGRPDVRIVPGAPFFPYFTARYPLPD